MRDAEDPYEALRPYFHAPRWREVVLLAAGYVGAVQKRTATATRLIERIRDTSDALEPILHRHLLLAAALLADRVPVSGGCADETLLRLVQACTEGGPERELAEAIGALGTPPVPAAVVDAARDVWPAAGRWELRMALVLLAASPTEGRDWLVAAGLDDRDRHVRAVAAILRLLNGTLKPDDCEHVTWPTATYLPALDHRVAALFRGVDAQAPVARLLSHEDAGVRLSAAQVLQGAGALGEPAQAVLARLLEHEDSHYRWRAAQVLQGAGALVEPAQAALARLLEHEDAGVRLSAAQVLQGAGAVVEPAQAVLARLLAHEVVDVRLLAAQVLHGAGALVEPAQAVLAMLLAHEDVDVRLLAAQVLQGAGAVVEPAQAVLARLLEHEDVDVRLSAAQVLQGAGALVEPAQAVLAMLLEHEDASVRLRAAQALQRAGAVVEPAQAVLARLLEHEDAGVRLSAAEVLLSAEARDELAQAALARLLEHEDASVRLRAAQALQGAGALVEPAQAALARLLEHGGAKLRWRAAEVLQEAGALGEPARAVLTRLLEHGDAELRWRAARVLQGAGALVEPAQAALARLLEHEHPSVHLRAAEVLGSWLERLEPGQAPPAWLAASGSPAPPPATPRAVVEPVSPPVVPAPADPLASAPADLLVNALTGPEGMRFAHAHELARALAPRDEPTADPAVLATFLERLQAPAHLEALARSDEASTMVRETLTALFKARLEALADDRANRSEQAAELEAELMAALPAPLLTAVVVPAVDTLGPAARCALLGRLLAGDVQPAHADGRAAELFAALGGDADEAERATLAGLVRGAYAQGGEPETCARLVGALASLLPHLVGKARRQTFTEVLNASSEDEPACVRQAVAWNLTLYREALTDDERRQVDQRGLPSLSI